MEGCPGGSDSKESTCNGWDPGSIPGSGRSPGRGNGNPLQSSCLGNPLDRGAWRAIVHGVARGQTQLSNGDHPRSIDPALIQEPHIHTKPLRCSISSINVFKGYKMYSTPIGRPIKIYCFKIWNTFSSSYPSRLSSAGISQFSQKMIDPEEIIAEIWDGVEDPVLTRRHVSGSPCSRPNVISSGLYSLLHFPAQYSTVPGAGERHSTRGRYCGRGQRFQVTPGAGEREPTCVSWEKDLEGVREGPRLAGQPCSSSSIRD